MPAMPVWLLVRAPRIPVTRVPCQLLLETVQLVNSDDGGRSVSEAAADRAQGQGRSRPDHGACAIIAFVSHSLIVVGRARLPRPAANPRPASAPAAPLRRPP